MIIKANNMREKIQKKFMRNKKIKYMNITKNKIIIRRIKN